MIRLLYNLLFPIALLFFLPGYIAKMFRRGNYRRKFGQRLGLYDRSTRVRLAPGQTWMHAVSVGEVLVALKLSAAMKEIEPKLRLCLTTTTATGFALAEKSAPHWMEVLYMPLDFWPIMRRAFRVIRPTRIVLVEAEVWPNLTAFARRERVPLALVNARLSPRSEKRFRRFKVFVRRFFQRLDMITVPEPEDVARWSSLGVNRSRIHVLGSIKFDPENAPKPSEIPRRFLSSIGIAPDQPILLGGSTHLGEEEILARCFRRLRMEIPSLFLILAPRHVERTPEIAAQLRQAGLRVARRSQAISEGTSPEVLLLDTTGELRDWYAVATVVFIGKSFCAHGGQNPVEAMLADRAVVFGPHMENFAQLARSLKQNHAALQPNNEAELEIALRKLLRDASLRQRLVQGAHLLLESHRGATTRTASLLRTLLSTAD